MININVGVGMRFGQKNLLSVRHGIHIYNSQSEFNKEPKPTSYLIT
jgi:hypothetical protein